MNNSELDEALRRNGIPVPEAQPWSWQDSLYWGVGLALLLIVFLVMMGGY